ncbi:hypothetical protein ACA040_004350 [Xenophilus aerolatus]
MSGTRAGAAKRRAAVAAVVAEAGTIDHVDLARFETFTLDRLFAHAREEDGHLLWTGCALNGRTPQIRLGGKDGLAYNVRRVVYVLLHGPVPLGHRVGNRCEHALCVHPDCVVARRPSAERAGVPITLGHRLRITATKRRQAGVLTPELVRQIHADSGTAKAMDARLGLTPGTASKVRRGDRWADLHLVAQLQQAPRRAGAR